MERKIGEIFEYEGITLEVADGLTFTCNGCYFYDIPNHSCAESEDYMGSCCNRITDDKDIIFKEINTFKFLG